MRDDFLEVLVAAQKRGQSGRNQRRY